MLNLNQSQLEFLIIVDGQDDWHSSAFVDIVSKHHQSNPQILSDVEFQSIINQLNKLTTDKIAEFQIALNILGSL